jgi:hypothetical protein
MNKHREEIISAALDGEAVDLAELKHALSLEEGRELLASFVMLRAEVAADSLKPSRPLQGADADIVPCRPVEVALLPPTGPVKRWPRVLHWLDAGPRVSLGLAASISMLAIVGAFWGGTVWRATVDLQPAAQIARSNADTPTAAPEVSRGPSSPVPQNQNTSELKPSSVRRPSGSQDTDPRKIPTEPPTPTRVLRFTPGAEWHTGL